MEENQNLSEEPISESPAPEEPLEKQLEDMKRRWMMALADMENLRKRLQREKEEARSFAIHSFAKDLIRVTDNLKMALSSCITTEDWPEPVKNLLTGIEMTEKELFRIFEQHGIQQVASLGQKFNANHHQAMFEVEDSGEPTGTIVQVLQEGYILNERLLRPALVGVSKGPK